LKQEKTLVPESKLTEDQLARYNKQRFSRFRSGKYTMIFPFNQASHSLAIQLNKQVNPNSTAVNVSGPNNATFLKQLISEVKGYYEEKQSVNTYY